MTVIERLALNPVEFIPERPEVDLHSLGLEIPADPGPDYGESSVTVERVRQAIGEGVTDRRWPSVECTIPLMAKGSKELPIADPLHRLEATVAEIQRKGGGWIRRDFSDAGGFAGSVACPIDAAALTGVQGWQMAHNQFAPNLTLKLSRSPIWYATVEQTGPEVEATGVRSLKWEIAEMLGTAPGLIRVSVKNEGATDWRGLMACIECDNYSPDPTADLVYECEALTLGSTAEVKTRTGASGGKVVRATLTAGWIQILDSKIAGVGHMTHTGVRRLKLRVFDESKSLGTVQLRLEYRALGSTTWSPNRIVEAPLVGNFSIIDLGECRPEVAVLGEQRWEWRLIARAPGGEGSIDLDMVFPYAVEQMLVVRTPVSRTQSADTQSTKSPGTVVDDASIGTTSWENPSNAKASDNSRATVASGGITHYLKATGFGFAIPSEAMIAAIVVSIEKSQTGECSVTDKAVRLVKGGVIGTTDRAEKGEVWSNITDLYSNYGGDLWGESWTPADINASTFGAAIAADILQIEGKTMSARIDHIKIAVYYTEADDENRVCFATRSIELRSDGVHRRHPTDEIWGRLIPEAGSIFQAPAGGLEKRTARGIVTPSQGDLGELADAGTANLSIVPSYYPGYLYAREAA